MDAILPNTLMSAFNAMPYDIRPLPDEMTDFGGDDIEIELDPNVGIDYEYPADEWKSINTTPEQAKDARLPKVFVDGAITRVEIAGSSHGSLGYARSIRAGELAAGALDLAAPEESRISSCRYIAITSTGYAPHQLEPLRLALKASPIPFELITWDPMDDKGLKENEKEIAARDISVARMRLRYQIARTMLEWERTLIQQVGEPVYADGLYSDHSPLDDSQLVVGIVKSMHRHYLDVQRLPLLYGLQEGQRTPVFEIRTKHGPRLVSFYVRVCGSWAGPTNGLVRVELSEIYFRTCQHKDFGLLDAIAAHLTMLRTTDTKYQRAAVTVEPIRVIESRMQRLFHPRDQVAMCALNILR